MKRLQNTVVYAAGMVQGIVLVTFPAASTIFTSPKEYGLSHTEYGMLFLPQVITAITASILGAWLARRLRLKTLYLTGLSLDLASMALLLASLAFTDRSAGYGLLLSATACLGAGFGLTVPAVNSLTAAFHPGAVDASVLTLNALLGVGTTLAPAFVALFVGLGFWWGLPVTAAALLVALLVVSVRLPMRTGSGRPPAQAQARARGGSRTRLPARFWLFLAFALLYGFCETVNGNWAQIDLTTDLGASATVASLALTAFWATVTVGRVVAALVRRWVAPRVVYHVLPFALAAVFLLISRLPADRPWLGVLAFGLAGLGCSALLPLTISFGQDEFTVMAKSVAGGVIAAYQAGYGVAAFAVGPLLAVVSLPTVFALAAVVAVGAGVLSFAVARRHRHPSSFIRPRVGAGRR